MPEINLTKGAYSVTIYCMQIEDGFSNKIFNITPATGKNRQDDGPKEVKVVDLLRITRSFRIQGYILSNAVKNDLIKIVEGAEEKGGSVTMAYADGGDATSFGVYVESCIITQKAIDEPSSDPGDLAKFDINMTLIKVV